jgi:hypothetical protein
MTIQLEKLVAKLELDNKGFKAGLLGAAAGIGVLVAGVGIAAKATFDWANDLDKLGDVMDGTNEEFAALAFVARKSGVGVDALAKANANLNKGLLKADGSLDSVGKKLKEFGIDVKDANGNVKDSVMLTGEIADKYSQLATQQERVNFLSEIYGGKIGKDMIDFFDTLAADGGIDAVTEKVKNLGLAIDPARYEKFNRNLEELKLIGLGLAVSFTEKIMPAVEGFLDLITDFAADPDLGKIAKKMDGFAGTILNQFAASINKWVNTGGADQLSDGIVSFIDNIGTGDFDSKALEAAMRVARAIGRAFMSISWSDIDAALDRLDTKVLASFDELDKNIIATFDEWDAAILAQFDEWDAQINAKASQALGELDASFANWSVSVGSTITKWGSDTLASATSSMSALKEGIDRKLSAISENFQRRAGAWVKKAADSLSAQKDTLLGAVQGIVDEINSILKKIKTSFHISFSFSTSQGVSSTSSLGNAPNSSGSPDDRDNKKPGRATGGAVLAGHAYNVVELNKPEVFTPNTSGRIDPKSDRPMLARMDRRDMRELVWMLAQENAKVS